MGGGVHVSLFVFRGIGGYSVRCSVGLGRFVGRECRPYLFIINAIMIKLRCDIYLYQAH